MVLLTIVQKPKTELPLPAVFASSVFAPYAVLFDPVLFNFNVETPVAVLAWPEVFESMAQSPTAVFHYPALSDGVMPPLRASCPIAVLYVPLPEVRSSALYIA